MNYNTHADELVLVVRDPGIQVNFSRSDFLAYNRLQSCLSFQGAHSERVPRLLRAPAPSTVSSPQGECVPVSIAMRLRSTLPNVSPSLPVSSAASVPRRSRQLHPKRSKHCNDLLELTRW